MEPRAYFDDDGDEKVALLSGASGTHKTDMASVLKNLVLWIVPNVLSTKETFDENYHISLSLSITQFRQVQVPLYIFTEM